MKIQANISISRDSSDKMRIRVQDESSRATFLEMELTPADLMRALTGLAYTDATKAEVFALDVVGKEKITEKRQAVYPGEYYGKREDMLKWLNENCKEDGWFISDYLGSRGSILHVDGKTVLNYSVYRFQAPSDAPQTYQQEK